MSSSSSHSDAASPNSSFGEVANATASFHYFNRLPTELRRQVWQQSLDRKRAQHLHVHVSVSVKHRRRSKYTKNPFRRSTRREEAEVDRLEFGTYPCPALHSCRDARALLQRHTVPPTSANSAPPSWLDLKQWTVVTDQENVYGLSQKPWAKQIANIHVTNCTVDYMQATSQDGLSIDQILIEDFSSLRDLVVFPHPQCDLAINHPLLRIWLWDWFEYINCFWFEVEVETESRCRLRVGVASLEEHDWLTEDNFTQRVYQGRVTVQDPENLARDFRTRKSRTALMAPVRLFVDYWELRAIDE